MRSLRGSRRSPSIWTIRGSPEHAHNWSTGSEPSLSNYPVLSSSFAATGPNSGILSFVASSDMAAGTVNIRAMLAYLISHGRVPANSTLGQICYGVEIVSTNGAPGTFRFTGFSLTDH